MRRQIEQALLLVVGTCVGLVVMHLPYAVLVVVGVAVGLLR
jgi:hypothetical protein